MSRRSSPSLLGVLCIFSICYAHALETQIRSEDRAPNSDTVIHHPAAYLSIAGDLKDLKLKSSIDQLVRALQTPPTQARTYHDSHSPSKPELITKQNFNVHSQQARKLIYGAEVPEPIIISSQAISINSNKTGGKRSRSMSSVDADIVDADGVRTIEGVRVPDDEHDKHHTWRNARVIKGFLVPNDKPANPHSKRQVVVHTDPQSYLAAAAAAQAQGATTIMDPVAFQQGRQVTSYAQSQLANVGSTYLTQNQRYQQQVQAPAQQPVQQPHQQYQYQLPSAARSQSGQTQTASTFAYAQQPGQMYVLQDDGGNTYVQYSPVSTGQTQQPVSQLSHVQSQFSSRSGEPAPTSTLQSQIQNDKSPPQKITQHQSAVQALQQTPQNSQVHQQSVQVPAVSVQPVSHSQISDQVSIQAAQQDLLTAALFQQPLRSESTGSEYRSVLQIEPQSRQFVQHSGAQSSQNGFVIQPQTYVTGPGGQTFTIPIPVPSDQAGHPSASQSVRRQYNVNSQQLLHQLKQKPHPHGTTRNNNFANQVMEAFNSNRKALERMEPTTAVVPALASTGIFLGLSALAAGWYLSRGNREVGIVRRTGKPAGHRFRRDVAQPVNNYPQEVDQATFFQSIIQQSLEKTQQQYENQVAEPVYSANTHVQQPDPVYNREPEPERNRPNKNSRNNRPQNRDDDFYEKNSKTQHAQEKSGPLTVGSSKNFARVFIPALILGVSVISITALIFGWYLTGSNREIAFLEPASYGNRKKRSLMGSTALSDGWLQKTISAMHHNPYDRMPAPTSKSLLPHPFMDRETSKTSDLEFKISNAALTGVLAGGALIAIVALGLANSLSETPSRQLKTGRANQNAPSFAINNSPLKHLRAPRSLPDGYNDLAEPVDNPGFLSSVLTSIEDAHHTLITSLHDAGLFDSSSPCSKRLVCELLLSEDDATLRTTEKRVSAFFDMLPDSVSKPWKASFGEIVSSVQKRDCSAFVCGSPSVTRQNSR